MNMNRAVIASAIGMVLLGADAAHAALVTGVL